MWHKRLPRIRASNCKKSVIKLNWARSQNYYFIIDCHPSSSSHFSSCSRITIQLNCNLPEILTTLPHLHPPLSSSLPAWQDGKENQLQSSSQLNETETLFAHFRRALILHQQQELSILSLPPTPSPPLHFFLLPLVVVVGTLLFIVRWHLKHTRRPVLC